VIKEDTSVLSQAFIGDGCVLKPVIDSGDGKFNSIVNEIIMFYKKNKLKKDIESDLKFMKENIKKFLEDNNTNKIILNLLKPLPKEKDDKMLKVTLTTTKSKRLNTVKLEKYLNSVGTKLDIFYDETEYERLNVK